MKKKSPLFNSIFSNLKMQDIGLGSLVLLLTFSIVSTVNWPSIEPLHGTAPKKQEKQIKKNKKDFIQQKYLQNDPQY